MADSYHNLGSLAHHRGDYHEAARQYQRALDINERLGNQAGMATGYHNLGTLAHHRGHYDEAARQYQRALDINERLGNQASMADSYHNLGSLAHHRGDYHEAARQYQRALDINERLGNQAGLATSCSQLGNLEADRGGPATAVIGWHVQALMIRLQLRVPHAAYNLRRLSACRREMGTEAFAATLLQTVSDTELAAAVTSALDQFDAAET